MVNKSFLSFDPRIINRGLIEKWTINSTICDFLKTKHIPLSKSEYMTTREKFSLEVLLLVFSSSEKTLWAHTHNHIQSSKRISNERIFSSFVWRSWGSWWTSKLSMSSLWTQWRTSRCSSSSRRTWRTWWRWDESWLILGFHKYARASTIQPHTMGRIDAHSYTPMPRIGQRYM